MRWAGPSAPRNNAWQNALIVTSVVRFALAVVAAFLVAGIAPANGRAALFFLFNPNVAQPGEYATIRTAGTPATFKQRRREKPFRQAMRLYLVSNAVAAEVKSRSDPRLHYIGSLVPGRNGAGILRFKVPRLESDSYAAAVWCPGCAGYSGGRKFFVLPVDESIIPYFRPLMLLRVQPRLTSAPTTCPVTPLPISAPPGFSGNWIGSNPLWVWPYAFRDRSTSTLHAAGVRWDKGRGWAMKFLWELAAEETAPVAVTIRALDTGGAVLVHLGGGLDSLTRHPILDPAHPGIDDEHPGTNGWSSYVYFPAAGCFSLDESWRGGDAHYVFAFGR
jgi:hypothetical protein